MSDRKVAGIILSEMDAQKLTEQLNMLMVANIGILMGKNIEKMDQQK